ncbi:MATE family efflux transporter [Candidatus Zixiibacteriota bacterium]
MVDDSNLGSSEPVLTHGNLNRAIRILAVPMVLEMSMESVFAVADIFFVGRISTDAVAVVGLTEAFLFLVYAISFGLAIGTTALVARRIGEQKPDIAARAAVQANWLGLLVSIPIAVIGILAAEKLLIAMGASAELASYGRVYLGVALGGNIVIMLLFINNAVFRGAGDAKMAMWSLWIANGINLILDPCLIFGLGPFPELGLKGAVIATVIGRGTGVAYQVCRLFTGRGQIRLAGSSFRPRLEVMKRLGRLSFGGITQQLVETASWLILVRILATFGATAVAGYTIAMRILSFVFLPAWGLANAAATLTGQNLGAGRPDRAERATWITAGYAAGFLFVVMLFFIPLADALIRLFTADPEVVEVGERCLRIISYGYVFFGFGMVMTEAFNGAGDTMTPAWLHVITLWLIKLPLALILANALGFGPTGVFMAITVSYAILAVLAVLVFRRGKWKERIV